MLPIISRKKGNLTKKFGELINEYMNEYNIYIYIYIYMYIYIYIIYLKKSLLK